ncbi:MAG: DUF2283 domain-containing protein [Parcubacteria group bacterium]|nr:DUF2283 domain-containing protein [Parcubacteria group bacterium]
MKYTYDPIADAINITFKKSRVDKSEEVAPGVILDFDKKGRLLYLEILDVSKRFKTKNLSGHSFIPLRYPAKRVRELVSSK